MKKYFKSYAIIWLVGVVIFSAVVFAFRMLTLALPITGTFIAAYLLVIFALAGQLALGYKFFNEENKEKVFLNLPLLSIAKSCLIVSVIVCALLMIIPRVPVYLAVVSAVLVLGFFVVSFVKADVAATAVSEVHQMTAEKTAFIKDMTVKSSNLVSKAKTPETNELAEKVYDAFKYSNKSGNGGLDEIEGRISANFSVFEDAVASGDDVTAKAIGGKLLELIAERDGLSKAK